MHWMNSSDWNTEAAFATSTGSRVALDVNVYGYADSVSVESIPGPEGAELLVLFRAEAGHSSAAVRVKDHILATMRHQPEYWKEIMDIQATQRAMPCSEVLDALAMECWGPSLYSGRDGQDFDHVKFAELLAESPITVP